jgi:hypothetical protein
MGRHTTDPATRRRDRTRHLETAAFIGTELAVAAFLLEIISWPLPPLGGVLFGIIGCLMMLFILSLWRWSVFYRQS